MFAQGDGVDQRGQYMPTPVAMADTLARERRGFKSPGAGAGYRNKEHQIGEHPAISVASDPRARRAAWTNRSRPIAVPASAANRSAGPRRSPPSRSQPPDHRALPAQ